MTAVMEKATIAQMKEWLKSRNISIKKLKSKAQFLLAVREAKEASSSSSFSTDNNTEEPTPEVFDIAKPFKYPSAGWEKNISSMPSLTFGNVENYFNTKRGRERGYKFFIEGYLNNLLAIFKGNIFYVKANCYQSQRKNNSPYLVKVALNPLTSNKIVNANCQCKAGLSGFCNHVSALLYQISHLSQINCKTAPQDLACTSLPRAWGVHRPTTISSKPVMESQRKKPRLEKTPEEQKDTLRCTLYEARQNKELDLYRIDKTIESLKAENPLIPFAHVASSTNNRFIDTKYGKLVVGSVLSYHLSVTEGNFNLVLDIDCIPRVDISSSCVLYPPFPLKHSPLYNITNNISSCCEERLKMLIVDEQRVKFLEENTQDQSNSSLWKEERKFRITASRFREIIHRTRAKSHKKFIEGIVSGIGASTEAMDYGTKTEPIAREKYRKMLNNSGIPCSVSLCGLVINPSFYWLGASPDGKVIDYKCSEPFGLLEIKCPFKHKLVTPVEACKIDQTFCCELDNEKPKLKKCHKWFYQVQGQMGITQASWCDFVLYTQKGLSVERITFDKEFWEIEMLPKLTNFYMNHFLPEIST